VLLCTHQFNLALPTFPPVVAPDYKHIMREEAMVTAGEMRQKYQDAESYEDDFM
jgi:hypothetical protein